MIKIKRKKGRNKLPLFFIFVVPESKKKDGEKSPISIISISFKRLLFF